MHRYRIILCILMVFSPASVGCNSASHTELEAYQKLKTIGIAIRDYEKLNGFAPNLTENESEYRVIAHGKANWRTAILSRLAAIPTSAARAELETIATNCFFIQSKFLICFNKNGISDSIRTTDPFNVILFTTPVTNLTSIDLLNADSTCPGPASQRIGDDSQQSFFVMFANGNVAKVPQELMNELLRGNADRDRKYLESRGVRFVGVDLSDFRQSQP